MHFVSVYFFYVLIHSYYITLTDKLLGNKHFTFIFFLPGAASRPNHWPVVTTTDVFFLQLLFSSRYQLKWVAAGDDSTNDKSYVEVNVTEPFQIAAEIIIQHRASFYTQSWSWVMISVTEEDSCRKEGRAERLGGPVGMYIIYLSGKCLHSWAKLDINTNMTCRRKTVVCLFIETRM